MDERDALRRLAEAIPEDYRASEWRWFGQIGREFMLSTLTHGRLFVMGFRRLGMRGAQPMFAHRPEGDEYHSMHDANTLAIREVPYRDDITGIDNPFARWIAAANPAVILALLDELDRAIPSKESPDA